MKYALNKANRERDWRTNNKIAFCQRCYGVLTPENDETCDDLCRQKRAEAQAARDTTKKKIWVYLNKEMLDLLHLNKIEPHEFSYFFYTGFSLVGVAVYDEEDIVGKISDREAEAYNAFWREVTGTNVSLEPHEPHTMRREGILSYLCNRHGISTERNVAAAIGELTGIEGLASPIDLINSL